MKKAFALFLAICISVSTLQMCVFAEEIQPAEQSAPTVSSAVSSAEEEPTVPAEEAAASADEAAPAEEITEDAVVYAKDEFNGNRIYTAPDSEQAAEGIISNNQAAASLNKPSELQWVVMNSAITGTISFVNTNGDNAIYSVDVLLNDNSIKRFGTIAASANAKITIPVIAHINESGAYKVKVSAVTDWNDNNFDYVESSVFNYVRPAAAYDAPTNLRWNGPNAEWTQKTDVGGYMLYLYWKPAGEKDYVAKGTWKKSYPGTSAKTTEAVDVGFLLNDDGEYMFEVRCLSNDINVTANSVLSAKSPIYTVGATSGKVEDFVDRLYTVALNRAADPKGKTADGATVAAGFINSKEMKDRKLSNADFVKMMYKTFFDRNPDTAGYNDWMNQLANGVSREFVLRGFANSSEFQALCDAFGIKSGSLSVTQARDKSPNLTAFVNRLYTMLLKRNGDETGLNDWCSRILENRETPKQVAAGFVFSNEFKDAKLSNEEFVNRMYRTFLGREADAAGKADWLNRLAQGQSREKIFDGFADSTEFAGIVASFGLK